MEDVKKKIFIWLKWKWDGAGQRASKAARPYMLFGACALPVVSLRADLLRLVDSGVPAKTVVQETTTSMNYEMNCWCYTYSTCEMTLVVTQTSNLVESATNTISSLCINTRNVA